MRWRRVVRYRSSFVWAADAWRREDVFEVSAATLAPPVVSTLTPVGQSSGFGRSPSPEAESQSASRDTPEKFPATDSTTTDSLPLFLRYRANKGVRNEWHCRGIACAQRDLLADGRFL